MVALLGVPLLVGCWYLARAFANVERAAANALLGQHVAVAPMASGIGGNLWVRLRAMTADPTRRRELGYLLVRFPVGVATFAVAVTALVAPVAVAAAPFVARFADDEPFGDWALALDARGGRRELAVVVVSGPVRPPHAGWLGSTSSTWRAGAGAGPRRG